MILFTVAYDNKTGEGSMIGNCTPLQASMLIQQLYDKKIRSEAEKRNNQDGGSKLKVKTLPEQGRMFPNN